jgi:hypothetical protein
VECRLGRIYRHRFKSGFAKAKTCRSVELLALVLKRGTSKSSTRAQNRRPETIDCWCKKTKLRLSGHFGRPKINCAVQNRLTLDQPIQGMTISFLPDLALGVLICRIYQGTNCPFDWVGKNWPGGDNRQELRIVDLNQICACAAFCAACREIVDFPGVFAVCSIPVIPTF